MMKSLLFGFLFLLASIGTWAQNCKMVKTQTDKFTKQESRDAQVDIGKASLFGGVKWRLEFSQVNGKTSMDAQIAMSGELNQVLGDETKFYFLLDNDEVVTLENTLAAKPNTQVTDGGAGTVNLFTIYKLRFHLSKEDLTKLGSGQLTDVKVDVPDQSIQSPNVQKKNGQQLRDVALCLAATAL